MEEELQDKKMKREKKNGFWNYDLTGTSEEAAGVVLFQGNCLLLEFLTMNQNIIGYYISTDAYHCSFILFFVSNNIKILC